jgi:phosphate transport system permease protein
MTTATQTIPQSQVIQTNKTYSRRKITNLVMLGITGLFTILALIPLIWIIVYVFLKGLQYLNFAFFTQLPRPLGIEGGGVLNAIEGTIILSLIASLFAIPPGILTGIYAANRPNTPLGIAVRFGTDVLSGIPTIIIGMFGYALLVKPLGGYSGLAGGIALAIVMVPIRIRTTEEMVKLVPRSLREGSLALGAPEWKTSVSVILPAALSGVVTGILLGLARASGETAPLLFTSLGNERYEVFSILKSGIQNQQGIIPTIQRIFMQPMDSLPLTLYKYSQQPYPERINQAWAAALVLMMIVFGLNILAQAWVNHRASRLRGK